LRDRLESRSIVAYISAQHIFCVGIKGLGTGFNSPVFGIQSMYHGDLVMVMVLVLEVYRSYRKFTFYAQCVRW